ncbi:MAG: ribose-phosphate diphosphokinase, partial [bacterium]|nr:ribose-phosphate diphosphokinase [bacterium]
DLFARPVLCEAIRAEKLGDIVVVAPDAGFAKQARNFASALGAPLASADKQRTGHDERAEVLDVIGDVAGQTAVIVDDFTISAGTLSEAARLLIDKGAKRVLAAVSHGAFTAGSMERIDASPIETLFVTDSIETQPVELSPKIRKVSVAPLFAEAIRRIHQRESISVLFPS